jgi:hypothetical protein
MTPLPSKEQVIQAIREAFAGVSRENGVTLHETDVIDDYGTDEARAEARKLDTDQTWEQVPNKDIEDPHFSLSFLDPKGFRYYIAPFMIWSINEADSSGLDDFTSLHLNSLDEFSGHAASRLALLNNAQRRAIAMFLLYHSEEDRDSADSVLRFWWQYLPNEFQI